jgi:uncharacterized protein YjdB
MMEMIEMTPRMPEASSYGDAARRSARPLGAALTALLISVTFASCDTAYAVSGLEAPSDADLSLAEITLVSGDAQEAQVGSVAPEPLVVAVVDQDGDPLGGAPVEWTFMQGRGNSTQGSPAREQIVVSTDARGRAEVRWELGSVAGAQQAFARIVVPEEEVIAAETISGAPKGNGKKVGFTARGKPGSPEAISVAPSVVNLSMDARTLLRAVVTDKFGNDVAGTEVAWRSSNQSVATVDEAGQVTAVAIGSAEIFAKSGPLEGTAALTVADGQPPSATTPSSVTDLSVTAASESSVTLGWTGVADGMGGVADYAVRMGSPAIGWAAAYNTETVVRGSVAGGDIELEWSGLDPSVSYQFQLVAFRGELNAGASFGGLSNIASARTNATNVARVVASPDRIVFDAIGETAQLSVRAEDDTGTTLSGVTFEYVSSNPLTVQVDDMGQVTARNVGVAMITIMAACCGSTDSVAVEVNGDSIAVESIAIYNGDASAVLSELALDVGQTVDLAAAAKDAAGDPIYDDIDVEWSSSAPAVATVDGEGTVNAVSPGSAQIRASAGDLEATLPVQVLELEPAPEGDLFFDGFETASLSTDTNGFSWASTNRTSIVRSDGCVVFNGEVISNCGNEDREWESRPGSGGSHALRFRYASGQAMTEQRFSIGSAQKELWASWWLRVPVNFEHLDGPSSDNNKLFMFWMDEYSNRGDGSTVGMEYRPDGSGGSRWYVKVSPGRESNLGGDQGSTPFISYPSDQGRWMKIVVRIKAETSADAADGLMQVWRRWEGESSFTQTHNQTNQPIRLPSGGPNGITAGYLMGYANSAYGQDTEFLIDDFTLSTGSLLNQ